MPRFMDYLKNIISRSSPDAEAIATLSESDVMYEMSRLEWEAEDGPIQDEILRNEHTNIMDLIDDFQRQNSM